MKISIGTNTKIRGLAPPFLLFSQLNPETRVFFQKRGGVQQQLSSDVVLVVQFMFFLISS